MNNFILSDKTLPYVVSKISSNLQHDIIVTPANNIEAQDLYKEISFLSDHPVFLFPEWDTSLYDPISPSQNILYQRVRTLHKLSQAKDRKILITPTSSLIQKIPPIEETIKHSIIIAKNKILKRDALLEQLVEIGYSRESITSAPLDFAVRGSVIDIQTTETEGVRINFFDSTIESIKKFDPLTQLSTKSKDSITIYPSSELILSQENIKQFKKFLVNNLGSETINSDILSNIEQKIKPSGIEHFLSKFYKNTISIISLLNNPTIISLLPIQKQVTQHIDKVTTFFNLKKVELSEANKDKLKILLPPNQMLLDSVYLKNFQNIDLISYQNKYPATELKNLHNDAKAKNQSITTHLVSLFNQAIASKTNFIISCSSEGTRTRIHKILEEHNIQIVKINSWPIHSFIPQICLAISPIKSSFLCDEYYLITESDIFNRKSKETRKTTKDKTFRNSHNFFLNSFITHKNHGIGQFKGLETIELSDSKHDCLKLSYRDNDKLFVPVENIDLLTRYSDDNQEVILDKLGAQTWKTRKEKIQKKIRKIAHHLLKLAAQRRIHKSEIIDINQTEYEKFCKTFPYVETEDQENAIYTVLQDLSNDMPMDRLICGDAGVGKTEIALRAAFATITSHNRGKKKQVALVAPTTLLCKQHFNSAYTRFKKFNINIVQLSRFTPRKEINNVIEGINAGTVDIVIGTHSLLSKKINFHNLSLLIVDEEQHFGVLQKEKLKSTKENINILTLSATPIPRTLQMSLAGIKELSLIKTSPLNRKRTKVCITEFNLEKALEAILREFHRNGQSFVVCPRIQDLEDITPMITEALPNLKITIAHGKMSNTELESKITDFYEGRTDVLLATSIIESGLDIPRANTIIVYKAEMFGLSQLYQLKGRVGRSNIDSSAYFMLSSKAFNQNNLKKLSILENMETACAGFMVSSHDMDIRGFGNLLGDEQSGNIKEIGVELYQEMLEDTMNAIKHNISEEQLEEIEKSKEVQINLGIPVLIPEEYIPDFDLRMSLYQKISSLETDDKIEEFAAEMIDRFGDIPESFENLMSIIKLKNLCKKYGIGKVDAGPKALMIQFYNLPETSPEYLLTFIKQSKLNLKLKPDNKIVIYNEMSDTKHILQIINSVIQGLSL